MKISLAWLKEYVPVSGSPDQVAADLTRLGLPVDSVETTGADLSRFVVGHVVDVQRHPNADKLTVCRVDVGQAEPLEIVCGAPNTRVGLRAAVALVGAVLPDGTVIKKARLRGVESNGMMCSERELGLSDEHQGIIDLGPGAPAAGTPLSAALVVGDTLFDIDVPSNRGDCFSHLGIARELAALSGAVLKRPDSSITEAADPAAALTAVTVEDADGCPCYSARLIMNVAVGPSPEWLVRKLASIGQRSINNVVDATNLILWESGQPLHAFDLDRLAGRRIVVRRARPGEILVTLDGQARALDPEILVIADAARAVALAGIMGGGESEVTDATTRILLECAWFNPYRVLRGTQICRLITEASLRFVRGVDPAGVAPAMDRCARLIAELAGGRALSGRLTVAAPDFLAERKVVYRSGAAENLLGEPISDEAAARYLQQVGFTPVETTRPPDDRAGTVFRVPPHRLDVRQECDLVEEVARLYGYDRLGERDYNAGGRAAVRSPLERGIDKARRAWLALGFTEMLTRALTDPAEMRKSGIPAALIEAQLVRIPEPQSGDESALRIDLLPGALKTVAHNLRHGAQEMRLFEIGPVFRGKAGSLLPDEPMQVLITATGGNFGPDLTRVDPVMDLPRFKGLVEAFLEMLRVDTPMVRCYDENGFEARTSAVVESRGRRLGVFGQVASEACDAWDIARPVFAGRFSLTDLLDAIPDEASYQEPSRFPASRRDLAFLLDADVSEARVAERIRNLGGPLLKEVVLFDRFTGRPLPEGRISLAYRLTWQSGDRTLSDDELRAAEERVVAGLSQALGAVLRDR